jgi:iron complex transport system substrate-binding protein
MGKTQAPLHPQRVVVLDTGELDSVLSLGIIPVGAVEATPGGGFLHYFGDKTKSITNVGTISQPNLEKIASLNPDLILSNKARHENIYKQLSQIAPTVFAEKVGVVWKDNFMLDAQALNKEAEARQIMDQYNKRITEFKEKIGDKGSKTSISVVRVLPDRIRLYAGGTFIGTILKDAGLQRPASQNSSEKFAVEIGYEKINDMDGDVIFVCQYGNSEDKLKKLMEQPQWQQLNGVKSGKMHIVSDDTWMLGIGISAANKVIDDLNTYVANDTK